MSEENFNPQKLIATTDDNKLRARILRDDESDNEAPPGVVKLSGTPAEDEAEVETLHESTLLYEG